MDQITLVAPDISCDHCRRTIEAAMTETPGVADASVDVPGKSVTVSYDPGQTSAEAIVARLEEEGYPATPA